jgi:hypothetical protein
MYAKNLLDDSISILANLGIKKDITEDWIWWTWDWKRKRLNKTCAT